MFFECIHLKYSESRFFMYDLSIFRDNQAEMLVCNHSCIVMLRFKHYIFSAFDNIFSIFFSEFNEHSSNICSLLYKVKVFQMFIMYNFVDFYVFQVKSKSKQYLTIHRNIQDTI